MFRAFGIIGLLSFVAVPGFAAAENMTAPAHIRGTVTYRQRSALPPNATLRVQLLFESDGKIVGSTGCNRLLGSYESSGEHISIAPGASTMMACPEPLMHQERAFGDALRAVKRYHLMGDELQLLDDDRIVARFGAEPAP